MNDQWLQHQSTVDESAVPYGGLPDSISANSSFTSCETMNDILVPENSSPVGNELSPRSSIAKPVRRRSRASRRTPTTLLNASIKNFRALVQQYTGCQSVASSTINHKGPINLSFGPSSSDHQQQKDFVATNSFRRSYTSGYSQFHQQQNRQYYDQEHPQTYQGQQGLFQSDVNNGDFSAFSSSEPNLMDLEKYGWQ